MRIGIISDTHIPSMGLEPPHEVKAAFAGVDLILHAGHAYTAAAYEWLEQIAPVESTDSWITGSGESLTRNIVTRTIELEGRIIGMCHELILRSVSDDLLPGVIARSFPEGSSLPDALGTIFDRPVELVVFGYTHIAMIEEHQGILLVNPGSPSLVGQEMRLGTVAILELTADSAEAHIVDLSTLG